MSIWIKNNEGKPLLAPHSYEKTLIMAQDGRFDYTVMWIEGTNCELSFKPQGFGIAGGAIGTNSGIMLTKEQLLEIAEKMKEGATLRVCGCNRLDIDEFKDEIARDNNMIQMDDYSFKPRV